MSGADGDLAFFGQGIAFGCFTHRQGVPIVRQDFLPEILRHGSPGQAKVFSRAKGRLKASSVGQRLW